MQEKYPSVSLLKELSGAYNVVVQKGNVTANNIYALQLRNGQKNTYVIRGSRATGTLSKSPALVLYGGGAPYNAGGHTQTWEYANRSKSWFIGTKANTNGWDTQIARVQFPSSGTVTHYYNTEMPRLSYLNRAGSEYGIGYAGVDMKRVEAAVSPNYSELLIASVDTANNGYFSIYDLDQVNNALDGVEGTGEDVPITSLSCKSAFMINDFVGTLGNLQNDPIGGSIQGYDIDDERNIYISSEKSPSSKEPYQHPRKLVKIPWGETNTNNWEFADLDDDYMDVSGHISELESIQVIDSHTMYLTVSYHEEGSLTTDRQRIYEIDWY